MYDYALQLGVLDFWDITLAEFQGRAKGVRNYRDIEAHRDRVMTGYIMQSFTGKRPNIKRMWPVDSIDNRVIKPQTDYGRFVKAVRKFGLKRGTVREISSKTRGGE